MTSEERRRVFLTTQQASHDMRRRLLGVPSPSEPRAPRRGRRRLLPAAMTVALLASGWLVYHAVEFHVPASSVETLLPRLE